MLNGVFDLGVVLPKIMPQFKTIFLGHTGLQVTLSGQCTKINVNAHSSHKMSVLGTL